MRYILVLATPSKFYYLLLAFCCWLFITPYYLSAELVDRVIAYVDERAITLREFNDYYKRMSKIGTGIKKVDALNTFINRILLLREAKKMKIVASTEEELLNEYIELKVKAFIRIREEDIRDFYNSNISKFGNESYDSARDRIEEYLIQLELNRLLKRHIDELRTYSYIKVLN